MTTTKNITLRLPTNIYSQIPSAAESAGESMADWLRSCITARLAEQAETDRLAAMEARICRHITREIDSLTQAADGGQP